MAPSFIVDLLYQLDVGGSSLESSEGKRPERGARGAAVAVADRSESELFIVPRHHAVLGRGAKLTDDFHRAARQRLGAEGVEGGVLDPAPEHPATHQPGVDRAASLGT